MTYQTYSTDPTYLTNDLLRVQLDDQLFLHGQIDLLAGRDRDDLPFHLAGEREPFRNSAPLHFFDRMQDRRVLAARLADGDDVTDLDRVGRDVDLLAVD